MTQVPASGFSAMTRSRSKELGDLGDVLPAAHVAAAVGQGVRRVVGEALGVQRGADEEHDPPVGAVGARAAAAAAPVFLRATSESRQIRAENSVLPEPMEPITRMRRDGREKSKWLKEWCTLTSGNPRLFRNVRVSLPCRLPVPRSMNSIRQHSPR